METGTRIVVAGASGFLGTYLVHAWRDAGAAVLTVGRGPDADAGWDRSSLRRVLDGADLLVNLAGRSVSCRYTRRTADEILTSRTGTTRALAEALADVGRPPSLWINGSTGTIYRDARDRPQDERSGELGAGFSVEVARAWERELAAAPPAVRTVAARLSIVLGHGGALNPMVNLARLGFGGRMGDGGQVFSWVHVDDVRRSFEHVLVHPGISGPVNVAAPEQVTNAELMRLVHALHGRGPGLPLPAWSLRAGARIIRTEAELVLKSRWVEPAVLRDSGFSFAHPTLRGALADLAAETPRGLLPVALG